MFFAGRRRWSKDVVRWELLARRQRGEDLSWASTPDNLRQIAGKYYGSYRKAVEAVGVDYESLRRNLHWTDALVVEELQKLHARGVSISGRGIAKESPGLHHAIYSLFGSVETARRAAGISLQLPEPKWTRKKIIEALRQRAKNREELAQAKVGGPLRNAATWHFGSYAKAIAAAGLNYGTIRLYAPSFGREQVIAELRKLDAAGVKLNCMRIIEHAGGLYDAMIREFGSTARALKEAGVEFHGKKKWNRPKVLEGLRQLQREGKDLSFSKVHRWNRRLAKAAQRLFGGYRQAIEALGADYAEVRTAQWSKERIISALRVLVGSGVKANGTDIRRADPRLFAACLAYFGRVSEALGVAGIQYQRRLNWSKPAIVRKLKEMASAGEDLSSLAMRRRNGSLVNRIWRKFGSYKKAIEAAGLDYLEVSKHAKWDRRSVLRKLRELAAKGVDVSYRAVHASHPRILDAAIRAFGSYPNARKAAGVGPQPLTRWTKEKIARELRKLQRAGESLAASRIHNAHPALYDAAYHHFGGYGKALEAIGLGYKQVRLSRAWTNDSIIAELKALEQKDVDMRSLALRKMDHGLHMAAYTHFGSYQKALEAAGIEYPPKKPLAGWTRSQVLARLRELHEEGEDLRYAAMKEKHSALFFAARYYFEAYIPAVKKAGLDYDRIVKVQLHGKKRWRKVVSVEVSPAGVGAAEVAAASGTAGPAAAEVPLEEKEHD